MEKDPTNDFRVFVELDGEKRISMNNLFALLENISRYGSISRAASETGVSYRYAWGLIQNAEKALGLALVKKQIGGYEGGGTSLTPDAQALLRQYKDFKGEVDLQLNRFVQKAAHVKHAPAFRDGSTEQPFQRHLLLASTMEPVETGLLDVLEGSFFQSHGVLVRHIALGSGRALQIAKSGRVDMVLTHAPELEDEFMREGWGKAKFSIMANDFVLVGPVSDPARIASFDTTGGLKEAFRKIASSRAPFISRGDFSGTHLRELKIWESADIVPEGEWYIKSSGVVGNLGILSIALEKRAYTFVDRATYLLSRSEEKMIRVFFGSTEENTSMGELENIFSLILVNPERIPAVNHEDALLFAGWLQSKKAQQIIADFGQENYGKSFFSTVNEQQS